MCTVTFIGQGNNNFILTSNRDEQATRSPQNISKIQQAGVDLLFPRDTQAGGSWIACSHDEKLVCLLNGAFVGHQRQPIYKRSRGTMVLDFFKYSDTLAFISGYDFVGMEAFTMVAFANNRLYELVWDEKNLFTKELNINGKYLWSSATLYDQKARTKRQQWFKDWLVQREDFSLAAIDHFHQTGGFWDTWNGFIMNRCNIVQTVSKTNIIRKEQQMTMIYQDFLRKTVNRKTLLLAATV